MQSSNKCGCFCHKMPGLFVALIGLTFLLGATDVISARAVSVTWPILVIVGGLQIMFSRFCKCCRLGDGNAECEP